MHYSDDPAMVRVDFFKESGKWYCTEAVKWIGYDGLIHDEFKKSLRNHCGDRLSEMQAVCLEPHNIHSHPISVRDW